VLEFRVLGPLEVVSDDGPIQLGGPKQRATLAILLLNANRVVSVERLADDLYAGETPVTAVNQVQRQISALRKVLGSSSAIETRSPGYVIRLDPDQFDLGRFERLTRDAAAAVNEGETERAAELLRQALDLWQGVPLADMTHEAFARGAIERLEEIRLAALEQRIEAELALGRHREVVGELEQLVLEHPLRESFRAQLMVALYRSGRQPEALDVCRKGRRMLVEEFGLEPTAALRDLERAILRQDPSLDLQRATSRVAHAGGEFDRAILVVIPGESRLRALLEIAEPLARLSGRELIIARLVQDEHELEAAASMLNACKASLKVRTRVATFTTQEPVSDVARLVNAHGVELVLEDAPAGVEAEALPHDLAATLERSPADVAVLAGAGDLVSRDGIFVPFGGGEHDWAALELAAWLALATNAPLRLLGTRAEPTGVGRDASRLLANASLAVQQLVGVETTPELAEPSATGLLSAVQAATLVVVGVSERWRQHGIGESRRALVSRARPPTLLVHRGRRPGGLAPRDARTRFSWTVEARYLQAVSTAPT
jgi:DNA-binding SARP family transcriptional activator